MRTEDDLRAALVALERYAPDAARVLPGARRGRRARRSGLTWRVLADSARPAARRRLARHSGFVIPAAAAATVVAIALGATALAHGFSPSSASPAAPSRTPAARTGLPGSPARVSITLAPVTPASAHELAAAARLISKRVAQSGLRGAATVSGRNVVLTGPAAGKSALEALAGTGVVRFRHVLLEQPAGGAAHGDANLVQPKVLRVFRKLACTPGESDTAWQQEAGYTTAADWNDPAAQVISCTGGTKYVLDKATVVGQEVTGVRPAQPQGSRQWFLAVTLNKAGALAFGALTTHQSAAYNAGAAAGNKNDMVLDQVAVVIDGTVVVTPQTQGTITGGHFEITGNPPAGFTRAAARELAAELQDGPLPVAFRIAGTSTSS